MGEGNTIQLTDEQLLEVEDMSASLMTPAEIAILLGSDADQFKYTINNKPGHPVYIAYYKGRLKTKLTLRKMVIKLAEKGSPQAEMLADKYLRDQNSDNL
jgi:hypothetical protein